MASWNVRIRIKHNESIKNAIKHLQLQMKACITITNRQPYEKLNIETYSLFKVTL